MANVSKYEQSQSVLDTTTENNDSKIINYSTTKKKEATTANYMAANGVS